jgi:AraC-type DNA-binding domain-containing proteins
MIYYSGINHEIDTNIGSIDVENPYFINCCGYIKLEDKSAAIKRTRVDYYLIYIVNGKGYYRIDDTLHEVPRGSVILYRPQEKQDYHYLGNEQTEIYWIHFTGTAAKQLIDGLWPAERNIFQVGIISECIQFFEKIIHEIHIKNSQYQFICTGYLIQILSMFSRENLLFENGRKVLKNNDIERCIRKMQMEYQKDHSINYYAQSCNLSLYHFIRKFKATTQLPPSRYIEKIRIDKSKELLSTTDLTVNEISNIVGFNDPFYFSNVFKKSTGQNPLAFRKHL